MKNISNGGTGGGDFIGYSSAVLPGAAVIDGKYIGACIELSEPMYLRSDLSSNSDA